MDTLRGNFDSSDLSDTTADYDPADHDGGDDLPPAAIGQDERRMQVRAYNHWAGLLGDKKFPSIEDLDPASSSDFGPYSVVLDFSTGIEDPTVQYLGDELAEECGADSSLEKLSDVPPRSLLSRITDHYLQILANEAPIGFEAEFVNQRGVTILYRGILLPFSSDDDTIDFIYGVINWKEMAQAATADELLLEIDQALSSDDDTVADEPVVRPVETVTDWADGPSADNDQLVDEPADDIAPLDLTDVLDDGEADDAMPAPAFGDYSLDDEYDEYGEDEEEDEDEADYDFASLTDHIRAPAKKSEAIDLNGLDALTGHTDDDGENDYAAEVSYDDTDFSAAGFGAAADESESDTPLAEDDDALELSDAMFEVDASDGEDHEDEPHEGSASVFEDAAVEASDEVSDDAFSLDDFDAEQSQDEDLPEDAGLYDCLASARELAQTARASEDRSRHALYAAVGRAYDFSLAAEEAPHEYEELIAESGLSVQERAPMTPVVKLVFGADYDKTRLTEYAAVLSHAHRIGIERGKLSQFLREAEGGLKGVVTAERRMRREEAGKPVEPVDAPREALARKLRELDHFSLEDIGAEGPEFTLVMIRRTEDGEIAVLGEIDDVQMIERMGRKLIG